MVNFEDPRLHSSGGSDFPEELDGWTDVMVARPEWDRGVRRHVHDPKTLCLRLRRIPRGSKLWGWRFDFGWMELDTVERLFWVCCSAGSPAVSWPLGI